MTTKSIRNVRPAWADIKVDHVSNGPALVKGAGPRSRTGTLSVDFLARTDGAAVPFLSVDAIGSADGASVEWRIVDKRTGRVVFAEKVAQ